METPHAAGTDEDRFADVRFRPRIIILATMPENLSETERKRYIYERIYGEPLPEDFFTNENK